MPTRRQFLAGTAPGLAALALAPTLARAATPASAKPTVKYTVNGIRSDLSLPVGYTAAFRLYFENSTTLLDTPLMGNKLEIPRIEFSSVLAYGLKLKAVLTLKFPSDRRQVPDLKSEPVIDYTTPVKVAIRHPHTGAEILRYQVIATRKQVAVPSRPSFPDIEIVFQLAHA